MSGRRRRELPAPAFDIPQAYGLLQSLIDRVDAMTYATERHFERFTWRCTSEVDETENPWATSRTSSAPRVMPRSPRYRRAG